MAARRSQSVLGVWGQPKMLALLLLGFSSGLPLFLTSKALQAWMTLEKVDLTTIGAFSLVALPYSLKFLWAPLLDRYIPPFLGRRRGWVLIAQFALMLTIAWMSLHDPQRSLQLVALNAVLIAFFSATQDVALDAYRTDVLAEKEMGAGAAIFVLGYRVALLLTGGVALILADHLSWPTVYVMMGALMLLSMFATWRAPEPVLEGAPQTLGEAVRLPFQDFFQRAGAFRALLLLGFIVIFKLPEYMAQNMLMPFLLKTGFTQTEIGAIQGGIGLFATIVGSLIGGGLVVRWGINKSLWVSGVVGAAANLLFYLLAIVGRNYPLLFTSVIVENLCYGLVTGVFVAFMMSMCNPLFSATQYALISSLMAASRDIIVAPAGAIAEAVGWPHFFLISLIAFLPGLALLPLLAPWNRANPLFAARHTGATLQESALVEAQREPSEK